MRPACTRNEVNEKVFKCFGGRWCQESTTSDQARERLVTLLSRESSNDTIVKTLLPSAKIR
jgi:hypothetical protein